MYEIVGWLVIVIVIGMIPVLAVAAVRHTFSRKPIEEKYRGASGGIAGGFDAVWSPSAHEANQDRDRQQRASIPAPTPSKGPGRMDAAGRITIEID